MTHITGRGTPRERTAVQAFAAAGVGAAVAPGAFGAFVPLLSGSEVRGLVVIGLLLAGGGLAVSAPFRLRGWPGAVLGALAAVTASAVADLDLLPGAGPAVTAAAAMAAGFALGGSVSAGAVVPAAQRAWVAAALTAGLTVGTLAAWLPYASALLAVVCGSLAARRSRPPGPLTLETAPYAALILATVVAGVLAHGSGPYPALAFLLLGPVLVGVLARWLAVPRLTRSG